MPDSRRVRLLVMAGLVEAVEHIGNDALGEAQRRAPVEEGTLRGSGEVDVNVRGDRVEAVVSFNTVYAARQHEETEWRHPLGGQSKYLESVLRERSGRYNAIIAAATRKALS
jgi:hypothetical protein